MKFYTFVALVSLAVVASLISTAEANNSTWGWVGPYDRLVFRENVEVKSSWMGIVSRDVVYPAKGVISYQNINAIKVIDHRAKNGGHASLIKGGPGQRNATIHLKSDRNHGLHYTIEIFTR